MTRVLVVDDHPVVREGLTQYLAFDRDLQVTAAVGTARAALDTLIRDTPDVVLLDMNLPDMPGPALVGILRRRFPTVAVLALSSFADEALVAEAVRAGVQGYLLKDAEPKDLRAAIKAVAAGQRVFHPDVRAAAGRRTDRIAEALSPRELQVLALLGCGLSNQAIAARLAISEKTVKTHVSHILAKLEVEDRTQAVLEGLRRRLIAVGPGRQPS
jgi:two-component system NarL family response regulator